MDFPEWLEKQLKERDWKPADLARAAGIFPSTLSKILNRERHAGIDTCTAIAKALKISQDEVFRAAGILTTKPPHDDPYFETLGELWQMTPLWYKHNLIVTLRAFVEDYQRREAEREAKRALGEPTEGYDVY